MYNLLKKEKFNNNVKLRENNFSLDDFKKFAKDFELLIGIDGGGFNYIRTCSNSITIYTIENYNVRSIFTGKNKYNKTKIGNNWFIKECKINGKRFLYLYKKIIILPTYDQEINSDLFNNIKLF